MSEKIRILLVDDHEIMRQGLEALLRKHADMEIAGHAGEGRSAVDLAARVRPDIVIMDIEMPGLNGIEATRQILERSPKTKVIALTVYAAPSMVKRMFKAGARGFIAKESAFSQLVAGIRAVMAGETFLCSRIADVVCDEYVTGGRAVEEQYASLTPRECEVLQLIAEGHTSKEIAAILFISLKTVDTHRQRLVEKLGIRSIAGLTRLAMREGFTSANG